MTKTEKLQLNIMEPTDPVSLRALNENTEKLDGEVGVRARMASGSWVGKTATAAPPAYEVYVTGSRYGETAMLSGILGSPRSSGGDINIVTPFSPKEIVVGGFRQNELNLFGYMLGWRANWQDWTLEQVSLVGAEYVTYRAVIVPGQDIFKVTMRGRQPIFEAGGLGDEYNDTHPRAGWKSMPNASEHWSRATTTDNGDGTFTTTIHGNSEDYETVSYADIEGMTYHWVAFG